MVCCYKGFSSFLRFSIITCLFTCLAHYSTNNQGPHTFQSNQLLPLLLLPLLNFTLDVLWMNAMWFIMMIKLTLRLVFRQFFPRPYKYYNKSEYARELRPRTHVYLCTTVECNRTLQYIHVHRYVAIYACMQHLIPTWIHQQPAFSYALIHPSIHPSFLCSSSYHFQKVSQEEKNNKKWRN